MELSDIYRKVGVLHFLQNRMNISIDAKARKGWVKIKSPLREDKNPSFSINVETGGWKDFATNETGDLADLVAQLTHTTKQDAIKELKKEAGITDDDFVPTSKKKALPEHYISHDIFQSWIANLHDETNKIAYKIRMYFFLRKGINDETLKKYNIALTDRNTVIYPYDTDDDGNVLKWKEIRYSITDSYECVKEFVFNSECTVFPYQDFSKTSNIVLCAGENDVLAFYSFFGDSHDFKAVTFTTGEGSVSANAQQFLANKNITILFDYDQAGERAALLVADILGDYANKVYISSWSSNEYVHSLKNNRQSFLEQYENRILIDSTFRNLNKFDLCDYVVLQKLLGMSESDSIQAFYIFLLKADEYRFVKTENNSVYQFYDAKKWAEIRKSEEGKAIYKDDGKEVIQSKAAKLLVHECYFASRSHGSKKVFVHYDEKTKLWSDLDNEVIGNCVLHLLGENYQAKLSRDISQAIREYYFISNKKFNSYTHLLNLANVTYDLDYCRAIPQKREYYFNYKTDYEYHENAQCPAFDSFLKTISMNDETWIDVFWEIAGFCLTHPYTYQKMFWFYGRGGRNGKGTLIRVMQKLLGATLSKADISPEKLSGNFFLQNLYGKRLATCGDMPGFWMNVDIIKKLTGGDTVTGAIKHQNDEIEFVNTAKLVFAMNRLPILSSAENIDPIKKRVVLLPFDYQIKQEDHSIERAFERELPGIFNKAIEGLKRLREKKAFTHNERSNDIMSRWNTNPVFVFIDEAFTYEANEDDDKGLTMADMFYYYSRWMDENATSSWKNDKHYCQNSWQLSEIIRDYFKIPKDKIKPTKITNDKGLRTTSSRYIGLKYKSTDFIN